MTVVNNQVPICFLVEDEMSPDGKAKQRDYSNFEDLGK